MEKPTVNAIAGAITDPYSKEAIEHAKMYYEEICSFTTDVKKIADNTGFTIGQIALVKNYLFYDMHELDGELRKFDSCFQIAESWRRLAFDKKNIQKHDITLINHELMELELVRQGLSQEDAHLKTSEKFNYSFESESYYHSIGKKPEMLNSGAIKLGGNTH